MLRKIFLSLPLVLLASCSEEPARLALQLTPGQETVYSYSYQQLFDVKSETSTSEIDQTLSLVWREVVQDASAESATIALTFESTAYEVLAKAGGENLYAETFDSNDPEANPSLSVRGYAGFVGRGFTVQANSTGQPIVLSGCDEMRTALLGEMYNANNMREAVASQSFERQISDQAFADIVRPLFAIYPSEPVRVGDSWEQRVEIMTPFPHGQDSTFTLTERKDGRCKLTVESIVAPLEGSPISNFGAKSARVELSGKQYGHFMIDEATGRVLSGRLESNLEGVMENFATEQSEGSTTPMKFTAILRIEQQ